MPDCQVPCWWCGWVARKGSVSDQSYLTQIFVTRKQEENPSGMMRSMVVEVGEFFVSVEVEAGILMRGGRANCNLVAGSRKRGKIRNYVKLSLIVWKPNARLQSSELMVEAGKSFVCEEAAQEYWWALPSSTAPTSVQFSQNGQTTFLLGWNSNSNSNSFM